MSGHFTNYHEINLLIEFHQYAQIFMDDNINVIDSLYSTRITRMDNR